MVVVDIRCNRSIVVLKSLIIDVGSRVEGVGLEEDNIDDTVDDDVGVEKAGLSKIDWSMTSESMVGNIRHRIVTRITRIGVVIDNQKKPSTTNNR